MSGEEGTLRYAPPIPRHLARARQYVGLACVAVERMGLPQVAHTYLEEAGREYVKHAKENPLEQLEKS